MKIGLWHRHHGVHKMINEEEINCKLSDVYLGDNNINEKFLLSLIPDGFLPTKPENILLTYDDENGCGTGQYGLNIFRNWSKYFDSYVLSLSK